MKKRKFVVDDDSSGGEDSEIKSSVVDHIIDVSDDGENSPLKTITTPINNPKKPKIQSSLFSTTPKASSASKNSGKSEGTPNNKNSISNQSTPKRELKLVKKGQSSSSSNTTTPKTPTSLNVNTNKSSLGSSNTKKQTLSPEEKRKPTTLGDLVPEEKKESKNSKKKFWNIANCQPVNYKEIEEWEDFVNTAEEKFLGSSRNNINVYIREDEVEVLYRWIESLKSHKSTLSARVARNVKERNNNSFDERQEEDYWKRINRLITRLKNLLLKHENFTTDDLVKMRECTQVRKKRIEDEKREHEQSEREHEALKNQSDVIQIKYFVFRDGPIRGQKEYFEWKSLINMKNTFSGTLAEVTTEYGDSDDELLNGDLF